jgi:hypothetical protein
MAVCLIGNKFHVVTVEQDIIDSLAEKRVCMPVPPPGYVNCHRCNAARMRSTLSDN